MSRHPASASLLSPLVYTKVRLPRVSNLLSRPRLLDLLHENIHRKLVLVCAGPGYGKTTLLADFARDTDLPVCWYTLDPSDRDPRTFLDYLVEAVRVHFPSFGDRTRTLLQQGEAALGGLRGIVGVLVNELAEQIPGYVVIVLDDYHTVDAAEEVNQTLDALLQYLPENVHMVVSGRSIPPLSLTRLAAYGEAAAVGSDSLRFTPGEVSAVLQQNFGLSLPEAELSRLVEESEGWITGVVLWAQAGRQGAMGALTGAQTPRDHVYAYLTDEVLRHLTPEVREFLLRVAIPSQVDAAFCDALLERHDSAQVLESLERRSLFLAPLAGGWYRFHSLFRDFLLERIRTQRDEFVRLQRRAAQLWQERGEAVEAVEHLLQAQAYAEAAQEIERLARDLFERSRFQMLARWIETLPEAVYQEQPRVVLFHGKASMAIGQIEKARASFVQAERLFERCGDIVGWVQALADRAVLERLQGAYQEALQTAQKALTQAGGLEIPAIVDLHRTIAVCLHALGDLGGAEEHARAAVEHSQGTGMYSQALAYLDLGFCLYTQGRMEGADTAYRQALALARAIGSPALLANILNNLAVGPFQRGEFQEAQELLQQALEAAQTTLSLRLQALVRASLGDLHRDLGDLVGARQTYERGLAQARQSHEAALETYLLDALGNLARQDGAFSEARNYLEEALRAAGSSQCDRTQVHVSLALLDAVVGEDAGVVERLDEAIAEQEAAGWRPQLLRAWVVKAIVQSMQQQQDAAWAALDRATALAEEMGVLEPFLAEMEMLRPLLQQTPAARRAGLLQQVLDRLPARPVLKEIPAVEEAGPALRILALGTGRVFRGEREILAKDWEYRLPRELFFYLLFQSPVRKEQIGLSFWPDRSAARVSSVFHATLYRARRAVGFPFVLFQEESYLWNPVVTYWCDVAEFERLLDEAAQLPSGDLRAIALLEQAVSLYQGDFLVEFDREWCTLRREELSRRYLEALLHLGSLHLGRQDLSRAQECYRRALQVDSFQEEAYRGLMRYHALAGERTSAIQVYRQCRRHLLQELQVEPSEETRALYWAIVRGKLPPQGPTREPGR